DLAESNVGPGKRRCKRQRFTQSRGKELLRVIKPVLTEQRARKNDLRFLKTRRRREHGARSRFRLRKVLTTELQRRFVQRLRQVLAARNGIVAVIKLRVELVRIDFNTHDFSGS